MFLRLQDNVLVGVFVVALFSRVVYVPFAPTIDPLLKNEGELRHDAMSYDAIAWNLATGQGYTHSDPNARIEIYPPLYPFLLAAVYQGFGRNLVAVRLVQALLGALTCAFLAAVGACVGGRTAGWLAGLGLACHPLYLGFTAWLSTETLYLLFFVLGLYLWVKLESGRRWLGVVFLGITWGLAALARPVFVVAPLLFFVWALLRLRPWRKAIAWTLLLVVCLYAAQAPWLIHRSATEEEVTLTSGEVGSPLFATLWRINNPYSDGGESTAWSLLVSDVAAWEAVPPSEQNRIAFQNMMGWILTQPDEYLVHSGKRLLKFFSPFEFGSSAMRRGAEFPLPASVQFPILIAYGLYLAVALLGLFSSFKRWRLFLPLYLTFGYFFVFHVFVWTASTRYAMPAMTVVVVWAACGLDWLWGRLRYGRGGDLVRG